MEWDLNRQPLVSWTTDSVQSHSRHHSLHSSVLYFVMFFECRNSVVSHIGIDELLSNVT